MVTTKEQEQILQALQAKVERQHRQQCKAKIQRQRQLREQIVKHQQQIAEILRALQARRVYCQQQIAARTNPLDLNPSTEVDGNDSS